MDCENKKPLQLMLWFEVPVSLTRVKMRMASESNPFIKVIP